MYLAKQDIKLVWKRIPLAGLYSQGGIGAATNLDAALQTVNSVSLFGKPPGTLKFEGYKPMPIESPLPPEIQQQGQNVPLGIANLVFDVLLAWSFFDPPYDLNANGGNPTRGHNLAPFRSLSGVPGNNDWYLIGGSKTTDSGQGNPRLAPFIDHRTIFQLVS